MTATTVYQDLTTAWADALASAGLPANTHWLDGPFDSDLLDGLADLFAFYFFGRDRRDHQVDALARRLAAL